MHNWREWRKHQRAALTMRRELISEDEHRCWSMAITRSLEQGFPVLQKSLVGFYWPHRGEYNPRPAMDYIGERGATLALPEIENKHEALRFRKWWREAPMKIGVYDIPVPDNTDPVRVEAVIIPMIGFDQLGFRLGYGGGYFDRTLAAIEPKPLAIGVAFEILRLDSVHPQPHDIPMDFIVTEAGIYRVALTGLELIAIEECARENALK
ncbi:5,10-methenyltetrahydrofolate synthetase [Nitrosospira sp. Nl5]|uniref:5-formyltetrahydrofolate cyclo-ligase n=1 Tax=Nitrosospira sp. Nl5 TaxID=200120 RepID=UPI00088D8831|nr:5-formyltetrahydrofolate cyclo-ligase [Nitrosospira sp. Nl5]SCY58310.1 5,10-methenyltetrahydrofolate synthetase [Nitrosospira sp. Nl5]